MLTQHPCLMMDDACMFAGPRKSLARSSRRSQRTDTFFESLSAVQCSAVHSIS